MASLRFLFSLVKIDTADAADVAAVVAVSVRVDGREVQHVL